MTHSLIFPFSFNYFESVVLYIILLEVARELSRFCETARRSKSSWTTLKQAIVFSKDHCSSCS